MLASCPPDPSILPPQLKHNSSETPTLVTCRGSPGRLGWPTYSHMFPWQRCSIRSGSAAIEPIRKSRLVGTGRQSRPHRPRQWRRPSCRNRCRTHHWRRRRHRRHRRRPEDSSERHTRQPPQSRSRRRRRLKRGRLGVPLRRLDLGDGKRSPIVSPTGIKRVANLVDAHSFVVSPHGISTEGEVCVRNRAYAWRP